MDFEYKNVLAHTEYTHQKICSVLNVYMCDTVEYIHIKYTAVTTRMNKNILLHKSKHFTRK